MPNVCLDPIPNMDLASSCDLNADQVFGPVVASCLRGFDFTLLFEQTILGILPNASFIFLTVLQLRYLANQHVIIYPGLLYNLKLVGLMSVYLMSEDLW